MAIKFIIRKKEILIEDTVDLTVKKALYRLELLPEEYLVVRNGELLTEHELLRDGDICKLVPVVSGG